MIRLVTAFERISWAAAVSLVLLAGHIWYSERSISDVVPPRPSVEERLVLWPSSEELDAAVEDVITNNPFRLTRRPSALPFGSEQHEIPQTAPPAPPQPKLILAGLVGGPPWVALLEGVPGREGPVAVRQGDILAGLSVRNVSQDGVIVAGVDTLWRLTLKRISP